MVITALGWQASGQVAGNRMVDNDYVLDDKRLDRQVESRMIRRLLDIFGSKKQISTSEWLRRMKALKIGVR